MSYVLNYKGIKILAKSADEAVELARKLANETSERKLMKDDPAEATKRFASFWAALEVKHKKVLQSLSENPAGLGTDALATATGIDATDLKYAFKTIQAQAARFEVSAILVMSRERIYVDKMPKSKYHLKEKARKAVQACVATPNQQS